MEQNKAEERALEVYPKMSRITEHHGIIPADYKSHYIGDANEEKRIGFIEGYHQAEKDLALTWEDIENILDITDVIANDDSMEERLKTMSEEEYCQEVLKRFNKIKEM